MSAIDALMHGSTGVALAYGTVQVPMLAAMLRRHAPAQRLLLSPLFSLAVMAVVGAAMGLGGAGLDTVGATGQLVHAAVGAGVSAALGYASGQMLANDARPRPGYQRGAMVVTREQPLRGARATGSVRSPHAQLTLAGEPLEVRDEVKHFKIIGATGAGKSTAIAELLGGALRRGDRAVIADPDGGYLQRFYKPERGDVILNPFAAHSVKWDPFSELHNPYDAEQLARAMIPDHPGPERSWRSYARTLFTSVLQQAHGAGVRDVAELYRLLVIADVDELRLLTKGTPAQPFLDEFNVRMFDSIRSVASSAAAALGYVASQDGAAFSVRDWVAHPEEMGGVLFIPYRAGQIPALRSAISAWTRIAIFQAMEQPEGDQRLWFVIDELDALGQIDGLKDALARLRKFGGRCVLGFQSIGQVASAYGAGEAHTLVENCGNTLILRCSSSEGGGTSRFASTLIGQREVVKTTRSRNRRLTELFGSVTRSEYPTLESAVLDSELEQLADLSGYLKVASRPEWVRVRLDHFEDNDAPAASNRDGCRAAHAKVPARSSQWHGASRHVEAASRSGPSTASAGRAADGHQLR